MKRAANTAKHPTKNTWRARQRVTYAQRALGRATADTQQRNTPEREALVREIARLETFQGLTQAQEAARHWPAPRGTPDAYRALESRLRELRHELEEADAAETTARHATVQARYRTTEDLKALDPEGAEYQALLAQKPTASVRLR